MSDSTDQAQKKAARDKKMAAYRKKFPKTTKPPAPSSPAKPSVDAFQQHNKDVQQAAANAMQEAKEANMATSPPLEDKSVIEGSPSQLHVGLGDQLEEMERSKKDQRQVDIYNAHEELVRLRRAAGYTFPRIGKGVLDRELPQTLKKELDEAVKTVDFYRAQLADVAPEWRPPEERGEIASDKTPYSLPEWEQEAEDPEAAHLIEKFRKAREYADLVQQQLQVVQQFRAKYEGE